MSAHNQYAFVSYRTSTPLGGAFEVGGRQRSRSPDRCDSGGDPLLSHPGGSSDARPLPQSARHPQGTDKRGRSTTPPITPLAHDAHDERSESSQSANSSPPPPPQSTALQHSTPPAVDSHGFMYHGFYSGQVPKATPTSHGAQPELGYPPAADGAQPPSKTCKRHQHAHGAPGAEARWHLRQPHPRAHAHGAPDAEARWHLQQPHPRAHAHGAPDAEARGDMRQPHPRASFAARPDAPQAYQVYAHAAPNVPTCVYTYMQQPYYILQQQPGREHPWQPPP